MFISRFDRFTKVKAKDLSEGVVYVTSEGALYLYLGKVKDSYVFYYAGVLPLVSDEDSGSTAIYAESQACDCYFNLVNRLVMLKNKDMVIVRRTMPEFIGVYRGVNFVSYVEELRVCLCVENMTSEYGQ